MQEIKKLILKLPRAEPREDAAALRGFPQHCSQELMNTGHHCTADQISALHVAPRKGQCQLVRTPLSPDFRLSPLWCRAAANRSVPQPVSAALAGAQGPEPRILPAPCLLLSICSEQGINNNSQKTTAG